MHPEDKIASKPSSPFGPCGAFEHGLRPDENAKLVTELGIHALYSNYIFQN